jgi:ribosome-associated protein
MSAAGPLPGRSHRSAKHEGTPVRHTDPQADEPDGGHFTERPSKTALKRQAHELQTLGQALAALPDAALSAAEMPELLRDAVVTLRRTRSHEGRRRQLQYVGKLMRDADVGPLREAVAAATLGHAHDSLALHRDEHWRVELVGGDDAVTRWGNEHPDSDLQRLRTLVRNARKDAALPPEQRHGRAWRELFQFIKPHMNSSHE